MPDHEQQATATIGILGWDGCEFLAADFERARRFYAATMDVPEIARLEPRVAARRGEQAALFRAGKAVFSVASPTERGARAARWLARRPDGAATIALRVRDAAAARAALERRGATLVAETADERDLEGRPYRWFEIAAPLGEVRFRFVERAAGALPPGFAPRDPGAAANRFGIQVVDHVASSFLTIEPFVTWLRDVLGFAEYWRSRFHERDVDPRAGGAGLAAIVMWDPESGIKFAAEEPAAPNFEAGRAYLFCAENRGPGVQHVAFHVPAIVPAVAGLRAAGARFLDAPASYYELLPERLAAHDVPRLEERIDDLRRLGILADGEDERYLLQAFMVDGAGLFDDPQAGPFFHEIIQRRGARGFGEGNFRAIFEALARDRRRRAERDEGEGR